MADRITDTGSGYTPEQIAEMQEYFKTHDFTALYGVEHKVRLSGKKAEVYKRAKDIFSQYWLGDLPKLGIKRLMKNYSMSYPIKCLQNTDADHFTEQVAEIYNDTEQFDDAVDRFFEMYSEPFMTGLESYSKSKGKEIEDLTDDEIGYVVEKVADVINEELIKVMMLGQQVPEVFGISSKMPTHEDFSNITDGNNDFINFHNKWTHCKTKLGAPLFFSELSQDEATSIEGARSIFDREDAVAKHEYEEIRDAFAGTLNSVEREIYYMREKGYTNAEISERLGYKTPSAVTKRLKTMQKKFREFVGWIEEKQRK